MGEIKRCPCCMGRKKLIGFGFMEETCANCKGVGSVEAKDDAVTAVAEVNPSEITPVVIETTEIKPVELETVAVKRRPGRAIGSPWKKIKE